MPIYEFKCNHCDQVFEKLQKLNDPIPGFCPHCGQQDSVHQLISAPHFRLAGKGWYETDFKKDGDRKHNLANKEPHHTLGKAPKTDEP